VHLGLTSLSSILIFTAASSVAGLDMTVVEGLATVERAGGSVVVGAVAGGGAGGASEDTGTLTIVSLRGNSGEDARPTIRISFARVCCRPVL